MTENATTPTIASVDDIDREFAARAFDGTSFDPEKRGESRREDYANAVNGLYAELWPLATTEEQRAILADEMERYRLGYLKHMTAYLASHSRVYSSMIAGPSNFPSRMMEKRNRSVDNRSTELMEWSSRAKAAIRAKLMDARPDEVKASAAWNAIARDIAGSLQTIRGIDDGTDTAWTRSAFVNSIAGKVERLAKNGEIELVDKALAFVREYNERVSKPAIGPRHKFWTFGELARERAAKQAEASSGESQTLASGDGFEIVANPSIDRVQILFDAKPDAAMVGKLKASGWRWSPREGAWQRQNTPNAVYSAKQIMGVLSVPNPAGWVEVEV